MKKGFFKNTQTARIFNNVNRFELCKTMNKQK